MYEEQHNQITIHHEFEKAMKDPTIQISVVENGDRNGRLFVFQGMGNEGNGTTTTLKLFAEELANHIGKDERILIIDANLQEPEMVDFYPIRSNKMNIDSLSIKASSGSISGKDVFNNAITIGKKYPNLYFVMGTQVSYLSDLHSSDILSAIFRAARQEFEYVLVDASAHFDNPGTVAALTEADQIVLVSNNDHSGIRLYQMLKERVYDRYWVLLEKMVVVLVDVMGIEHETDLIEEKIGLEVIAHLPYIEDSLLMKNNHEQYVPDLDYVAGLQEIMQKLGLQLAYGVGEAKQSPKKDKRFFSFPKLLKKGV